jgi:hypothetical protein
VLPFRRRPEGGGETEQPNLSGTRTTNRLLTGGAGPPAVMSEAFRALVFLLEPVGVAGVLLPLLLSAATLALARRPWRRAQPAAGGLWGGALALGGGYLAGAVLTSGWPPIPPLERIHWLFFLTAAATLFGVCDALGPWPRWGRWTLRLYFLITALWLLLRPVMVNNHWQAVDAAGRLALLCLGGLAFWGALDALADRLPGASLPLTLLIVGTGTALVLALCGGLPWARLEVGVLAALAACLGVAGWNPRLSLARGAGAVLMVLLPGMWLLGYFYAEVPLACVLLLALGALAGWLGQFPGIARLTPWQAVLFRVAAALVPVAWAVARAYSDFPGTEDI